VAPHDMQQERLNQTRTRATRAGWGTSQTHGAQRYGAHLDPPTVRSHGASLVRTLARTRVFLFAAGFVVVLGTGCTDSIAPAARRFGDGTGVFRASTPCPDPAQRTTGGFCLPEYNRLDSIIGTIYTGTPACATMQSALRAWLQAGRILRLDTLPALLGDAWGRWSEEWNNGTRLDSIRINIAHANAASPYDWGSTLRHAVCPRLGERA
jgi:hypothetical protein